ncbi:unnamed protein product (macronuclear) [Paramecium tetraurelia]|uniref:Uncharacterized protein n=1 Tax=Paramecium tetraurelia TaxID=5888 RepID=A0CTD8_PARTE|nr:uncharacterized protein GSPATT00010289001 [Paramecium tetraurelia]CAK74055.1 unnamed protein product [Paramecium tetraurelia]|eukprot:XP_001441452.1 hypothetical protein (macronuclear) [Paramecium tetraurelia strain d4-2]
MSRSMRKGNTPALNSQIRPFSPNLTFKTDQLENQVLQPCQEKAEVQYLRFEIQQERQRSSQLEMQLQCEINQRVQNEQLFTNDINILRQQNEDYKLRIQELEIKFRENSIQYQNLLKESNDKVVTMSIEIERLHNLQLNKYNDNEQILRQNDQKQLAQELIAIQKLVEDLRNELITKQKTIYYLQEQLQMTQSTQRDNIGSNSKLREQEKNIDQLVSQINVLTQILEDKENSLQQQSKQVENIFNELQQVTLFNRQLNEENRNQKQALDQSYKEIERLNRIIIIKNQELQDSYHSENLDWRRNFQDLNEKYHKCQEQLCFAQAELEACRATQRMAYLQSDK